MWLKSVIVPVASALIGGVVVVGALKTNPKFLEYFEESSDSQPKLENEAPENEVLSDILEKQKIIHDRFDSLFDDDFFGQDDPFEEMRKMRERMQEQMEALHKGDSDFMNNPFDSWFSDRFGGGSINDIAKREDDKFVYYDIEVDDVEGTSINTKVENGYITITGTAEKQSSEDDSMVHQFRSTFQRTFPLPENVDESKMEMETNKNKITLKFPKTNVV